MKLLSSDNKKKTFSSDNKTFLTLVRVRDGRELDYSRWQQSLIGVLMIDIEYDEEVGRTLLSNKSIFFFSVSMQLKFGLEN